MKKAKLVLVLLLLIVGISTSFAQCNPSTGGGFGITSFTATNMVLKNAATNAIVTRVAPNTTYRLSFIPNHYYPLNAYYCLTPVLGFTSTNTQCLVGQLLVTNRVSYVFTTAATLNPQGIWFYIAPSCVNTPMYSSYALMFNYPRQ